MRPSILLPRLMRPPYSGFSFSHVHRANRVPTVSVVPLARFSSGVGCLSLFLLLVAIISIPSCCSPSLASHSISRRVRLAREELPAGLMMPTLSARALWFPAQMYAL